MRFGLRRRIQRKLISKTPTKHQERQHNEGDREPESCTSRYVYKVHSDKVLGKVRITIAINIVAYPTRWDAFILF